MWSFDMWLALECIYPVASIVSPHGYFSADNTYMTAASIYIHVRLHDSRFYIRTCTPAWQTLPYSCIHIISLPVCCF